MPRCKLKRQKETIFHRLTPRRNPMQSFEEDGAVLMPGLPLAWSDGSQVQNLAFNGSLGASRMKRRSQPNLQFNNCFSFPVNAVWGSGGPNALPQQQWSNQNGAHHGNSSMNVPMNYGSSSWGNQPQGWGYPRLNLGHTLLPTPGKQNRRFSAGDSQRPAKRYKSDLNSEVPEQFLDAEGNEPVTGFMTLTPKGCSPNSLVCRINEDLRSKFGYSGRPVTYSRFCQHHHMLKFPGQWVLSLVIRNLNPLKVGESSVFITECPPLRGPGAAAAPKPRAASASVSAPPPAPSPQRTSAPKSSSLNKSAEIVIDLEASSDAQPLPPVKSTSVDPPLSRRKRKKIQSLEDKRLTNRPRGVFAGGVQPHSVVLLVDSDAPYVSADTLVAKNHKVLTGRNLGALDYMSLIEKDETISKDGVLFVVIPWLSFALKYFELFPCLATSGVGDAASEHVASVSSEMRSNAGNEASSLLNIVKDFQQQLDPQDFLTLTTSESMSYTRNSQPSSEGSSPSYVRRIVTQRLLYSALLLRSLVRTSYDNCDVVFCGFPVHAMSPAGASKLFSGSPGNSASQVPVFCGHLLAALHVFNEFAANTWRLGYVSKVPSFNCAPEPPRPRSRRSQSPDVDIEILSEIQSSNNEERSPPRKLPRTNGPAAEVTLVEDEHLSVTIVHESTSKITDEGTTIPVSDEPISAANSKGISPEDDVAVCEPSVKPADRILPVVCEKGSGSDTLSGPSSQPVSMKETLGDKNVNENSPCKKQSEAFGKTASIVDENVPEEDANVLCIDNTEVFDDDDEDQCCAKTDDDDDDIEIIELPVGSPASNTSSRRPCNPLRKPGSSSSKQRRSSVSHESVPVPVSSTSNVQSVDSDADDTDDDESEGSSGEDVQDPNCIPLMRLYRHRWFGKRRKLAETEPSNGGRRVYANRRTEDTSRWFMEKLMQLLRLSSDFAKNRSSMVPWEVPRAVPPAEGVVPGAVAESLRAGVYQADGSSTPTEEYRCTVCKVALGSAVAADHHAYSWQHCEAVASCGGLGLSVTERLLGRSPLDDALTLSPEYLERAARSRTLHERGALCRCGLCGQTVPRHALRHHVSSRKHLANLNSSLGLPSSDLVMLRHQHWRLYRDLLARHPAMDVVVVTDEVNHCVVQSLARLHPRVTVLSYSDFLRDPAGRVAAVQEWQQRNTDADLTCVPPPHVASDVTEPGGSSVASDGPSVATTSNASAAEVVLENADDDDDEEVGSPKVLLDPSCSGATGESDEVKHAVPGVATDNSLAPVESVGTSNAGASKETALVLDISGDFTEPSLVGESGSTEQTSAVEVNSACETSSPAPTPVNENVKENRNSACEETSASCSVDSEGPRSVLWLIVTGIDLLIPSDNSEEFADIDEIMSRVYEAHAYLRLHLPSDHVVLTTPVLPLTILEDTLPRHLTSPLMNGSNAIRTSPDKVEKVVQLYKLLFSRSLAVHSANAAHENVFKINKSAVSAEVVRILTSEQLEIRNTNASSSPETIACSLGLSAHYFASSPWHVAMESLVGQALYGLPCPYLSRRPSALSAAAAEGVSIREMEPVSRLCRAGVVGELKFDRSSSLAYKKVSCHKRWLQFDASDLAFILQLTKTASENSAMTWCLTAPFPKIVMRYSPNPSCVVNRCKKGLRLWQFQSPEVDVALAQLQLRSFLTELQCKLPDGNFANVFPAYPCNFVTIDNKTDEETHQTIHRLHRSMANTYFTRENEADVRAVFEGLADAWRRIFFTNKLGHSLASDCVGLASVSVYQLRESAAVVHRNSKRQVNEWLDAVTSYFGDYDAGIAVQLRQPAETAVDDPIVVE